ncbi:hypothetical protein AK812_SmicGene28116 [Symbiodinium microadriaticum]|uniref:Uncharacterized protein n=1 Tax=Symbiodinium microadriaticum TaxID=2951 RepID=A0A1Q9D5C5_SYMMI|nr:hypothetical protein AK812_SmicGene28116 [Symbiodinium microadriaticum]
MVLVLAVEMTVPAASIGVALVPESPPAKKPRHRMEDTLRQMVRTGQLSLDGKKLSLTSDEVPRLQQEVAKQYGRMGG